MGEGGGRGVRERGEGGGRRTGEGGGRGVRVREVNSHKQW